MKSLAVLLVVLAFLVGPAIVEAQSTAVSGDAAELEVEARARFQLGQLYYSQARFAEAADEFEAAYAIHPHPLLLHNVYLARRDLGDLPGAVDALTRYLASATDLSAADRRLLEGRLATMQRQVASATSVVETPVVVEEPTSVPIAEVTEVDEGAALADPETPSTSGIGIAPGAVVLSLGVAALIGAAIAGGVAEAVRGERDGMCTLPGDACPASVDQSSYASRFAEARDAGWTLLVIGAVTSTIGAVLLGVGASSSEAPVVVGAACDGAGCSASVRGSF